MRKVLSYGEQAVRVGRLSLTLYAVSRTKNTRIFNTLNAFVRVCVCVCVDEE